MSCKARRAACPTFRGRSRSKAPPTATWFCRRSDQKTTNSAPSPNEREPTLGSRHDLGLRPPRTGSIHLSAQRANSTGFNQGALEPDAWAFGFLNTMTSLPRTNVSSRFLLGPFLTIPVPSQQFLSHVFWMFPEHNKRICDATFPPWIVITSHSL